MCVPDAQRLPRLQQELTRATESTLKFVDTDFFKGIQQRCRRLVYILQWNEGILTAGPNAQEQEEAKLWEAVKQQCEEEEERRGEAESGRRDGQLYHQGVRGWSAPPPPLLQGRGAVSDRQAGEIRGEARQDRRDAAAGAATNDAAPRGGAPEAVTWRYELLYGAARG